MKVKFTNNWSLYSYGTNKNGNIVPHTGFPVLQSDGFSLLQKASNIHQGMIGSTKLKKHNSECTALGWTLAQHAQVLSSTQQKHQKPHVTHSQSQHLEACGKDLFSKWKARKCWECSSVQNAGFIPRTKMKLKTPHHIYIKAYLTQTLLSAWEILKGNQLETVILYHAEIPTNMLKTKNVENKMLKSLLCGLTLKCKQVAITAWVSERWYMCDLCIHINTHKHIRYYICIRICIPRICSTNWWISTSVLICHINGT